MQLNTEVADREFKASTGWWEKFKTWHGIRKYLNWQFYIHTGCVDFTIKIFSLLYTFC